MTFNVDRSKLPRQRRPVGGFYWDLTDATIFVPAFPDGAKDLSIRFLALSSASGRTIIESERLKIRRHHAAKARAQ